MSITLSTGTGNSGTVTKQSHAKQYYVYIQGIKRTDCKLVSVHHDTGGRVDEALLEFPRNYFYNMNGLKPYQSVKITIEGQSNPIFCGELWQPESENPSGLQWTAVNCIRKLNNYPVHRIYNKQNNAIYS